MTSEWKELFYTCDHDGDFVRLVQPGKKHGNIFPDNQVGHIFDIKLLDGTIYEKCFIYSLDNGVSISAITQDEHILELEGKTMLRSNPDQEVENKLSRVYRKLIQEKNKQLRISRLRQRKAELETELQHVKNELSKLE